MTNQNYSYPIDPNWTTAELESVVQMLNVVEDAYEVGVSKSKVLKAYEAFKRVVPAKSEEKRLGREFYKKSGYQLYDVVKQAQTSNRQKIKLSRG